MPKRKKVNQYLQGAKDELNNQMKNMRAHMQKNLTIDKKFEQEFFDAARLTGVQLPNRFDVKNTDDHRLKRKYLSIAKTLNPKDEFYHLDFLLRLKDYLLNYREYHEMNDDIVEKLTALIDKKIALYPKDIAEIIFANRYNTPNVEAVFLQKQLNAIDKIYNRILSKTSNNTKFTSQINKTYKTKSDADDLQQLYNSVRELLLPLAELVQRKPFNKKKYLKLFKSFNYLFADKMFDAKLNQQFNERLMEFSGENNIFIDTIRKVYNISQIFTAQNMPEYAFYTTNIKALKAITNAVKNIKIDVLDDEKITEIKHAEESIQKQAVDVEAKLSKDTPHNIGNDVVTHITSLFKDSSSIYASDIQNLKELYQTIKEDIQISNDAKKSMLMLINASYLLAQKIHKLHTFKVTNIGLEKYSANNFIENVSTLKSKAFQNMFNARKTIADLPAGTETSIKPLNISKNYDKIANVRAKINNVKSRLHTKFDLKETKDFFSRNYKKAFSTNKAKQSNTVFKNTPKHKNEIIKSVQKYKENSDSQLNLNQFLNVQEKKKEPDFIHSIDLICNNLQSLDKGITWTDQTLALNDNFELKVDNLEGNINASTSGSILSWEVILNSMLVSDNKYLSFSFVEPNYEDAKHFIQALSTIDNLENSDITINFEDPHTLEIIRYALYNTDLTHETADIVGKFIDKNSKNHPDIKIY